MKTPKYKVGDIVKHLNKKKFGNVLSIINGHDKEDRRAQGYRYEIWHSSWIWSVPEDFLKGIVTRKSQN